MACASTPISSSSRARPPTAPHPLRGEYENLNQASLYKIEVSGFGGEDLTPPLSAARNTSARRLEQRLVSYHDWGRLNLTFNFISGTDLENSENDFGYVWGVFRQPKGDVMRGMKGMESPPLSAERLGYGFEMMGALGNVDQFGFDWPRQQQYLGPVFSYALPDGWRVRLEPAFGLSDVSDRFVLRMALDYSISNLLGRLTREH